MPLPTFRFKRRSEDEAQQTQGIQDATSLSTSAGPSNAGISAPETTSFLVAPSEGFRSRASSFSSIRSTLTEGGQQSRKHNEADAGPLGLSVVYAPEGEMPKADIVFIHGLGGTSRFTWSRDKNPDLFWPMHFLPQEADIGQARILTFGYNANFRRKGGVSVSITDFAKDLLFDLRHAKDDLGDDLDIGKVPLIFVVHSMGGLIIKEAYIQGQNDPEYETIVKAISAITFLATPHRGTNLASMLNGILQSTFFNNSKQYISDLNQNSIALQRLNDQFRHIAPKLDIISFYETRPTSLGLKNASVMILGQDSSVLGYPGETSKALDADHHNVCKYQGLDDPNYVVVRNALKSLMAKVLSGKRASNKQVELRRKGSRDVKSCLGITDMPDTDYIFFQDQWAEGTSRWILEDPKYIEWSAATSNEAMHPRVLWLNGGPATGKSVLSSFIINELVKQGHCCQYFFVRFGDQKKRSLNFLLRSIAYQLAQAVPAFSEKIMDVADEGLNLENVDTRTLWDAIFKSGLAASTDSTKPLYWIVDGLDEAKDPRALMRQFGDLSLSTPPIRILLVSRKTPELLAAFHKISPSIQKDSIAIEGRKEDLRSFVRQELTLTTTTEYLEEIADRIVDGAQNNFLWVRLAVDKINSCHTQADVDSSLHELPVGMEALYDRMASSIIERPSQGDRSLATTILQCVLCSLRTLTIAEVAQALDEDVSKILDLQTSILDLCAGFVVIDNGGNVAMVHQTAREYLTDTETERPLLIRRDDSNCRMLLSCMKSLMTTGLRAKIAAKQFPEFLDYAAISWSKHLTQVSLKHDAAIATLNKFLNGPWILTWIQYLASTHQLAVLVQAARHLSVHFSRIRHSRDTQEEEDSSRYLQQALLEGWSTDLVKVVGKFGLILRRQPDAVYKMIPPFCPPNSTIYQVFGKAEARNIAVSGISSDSWDDSVARISFGLGTFATSFVAAANHLAILATSGPAMKVLLYESSTFEELLSGPIRHGERVLRLALNNTGSILATYGYRTTKVWDVTTGQCMLTANNFEIGQRPLTMLFLNDDSQLVVGTDDRAIRVLDITDEFPIWQLVAELEEPELDGFNLNAASYMALNRDASLIAVAYRGHPLSAWETEGPLHLGHCWRKREEVAFGQVVDVAWNPHQPEVFGIYMEGTLFRWRPYDDDREELPVGASKLSISRDGSLVATGDARGTIKVFTTNDLDHIYQLTSEDTVLGLAFSPDLFRIYDIRGDHGNVWEPSALIKFVEQNAKGIDGASETESLAFSSRSSAISRSGRIDSVTALAAAPMGRLYAYGTDRGTVFLYDARKQTGFTVYTTKNFLGIEQITWSSDGKYLSFALSGKRVLIMSVRVDEVDDAGIQNPMADVVADISLKSHGANLPILQLLFQQNSGQLAVFTSATVQSISLESLAITNTLSLTNNMDKKWIAHPSDAGFILGVASDSIILLDWNLVQHQSYHFECPPPLIEAETRSTRADTFPMSSTKDADTAIIDRVLIKQGREPLMLVQMSLHGPNSKRKEFLSFDMTWFSTSPSRLHATASSGSPTDNLRPGPETPATSPVVLRARHFFTHEVSDDVAQVLNFTSNGHVVYLSRNFAVCTWQMSSARLPTNTRLTKPSQPMATLRRGISPARASPSSSSTGNMGIPKPLPLPQENGIKKMTGPLNSAVSSKGGLRPETATAGNSPSSVIRSPSVSKPNMGMKELFYLPRDWINHDCLALSVLWVKEKSLLCPRNGEVAVVRSTALM